MNARAPLRLDLDGTRLVANWRWLAARSGAAACGAAIKADGYGLGAGGVVERLAAAGCRDFFVSTWAEAAALGDLPEGLALAVLHGVRAEDMRVALGARARPVLDSAEQVRRWREAGGGACDVMVDTGMNRLGLTPAEATSGLLDGLAIGTLMGHLACADEPAHALNALQLARFAELRRAIPARRYSLANSAGILLGHAFAHDLTRPGIALYGGVPTPAAADGIGRVVRPHAAVLQMRAVASGETVGYGATWTAERPARIAILNIGYADGLLRMLGPHLRVRRDGRLLPAIGRVSMDLLAIEATGTDIVEGDWLEIDYDLPALAAATGLSQYELLTGLGPRFERRWS